MGPGARASHPDPEEEEEGEGEEVKVSQSSLQSWLRKDPRHPGKPLCGKD